MAGLRRSPDIYYEVVEDKAVIVDPEGKELLTLNEVGTIVWEAIDGEHDEEALVDVVAARFPDVARETLDRDVRVFLDELKESELLERPA